MMNKYDEREEGERGGYRQVASGCYVPYPCHVAGEWQKADIQEDLVV